MANTSKTQQLTPKQSRGINGNKAKRKKKKSPNKVETTSETLDPPLRITFELKPHDEEEFFR